MVWMRDVAMHHLHSADLDGPFRFVDARRRPGMRMVSA
jgi:hypothetical protein